MSSQTEYVLRMRSFAWMIACAYALWELQCLKKRLAEAKRADAGLGEVRRQIAYKAQWQGRTLVAVDRFYPSSKTCGACGAVNGALALKDRRWTCPACGTTHDRDLNAAQNIEREGLRLLAEATGPDGPTPRSGESDARGVDAGAIGGSSPVGQPTTQNRELIYRRAKPGTTRGRRVGTARRVEG